MRYLHTLTLCMNDVVAQSRKHWKPGSKLNAWDLYWAGLTVGHLGQNPTWRMAEDALPTIQEMSPPTGCWNDNSTRYIRLPSILNGTKQVPSNSLRASTGMTLQAVVILNEQRRGKKDQLAYLAAKKYPKGDPSIGGQVVRSAVKIVLLRWIALFVCVCRAKTFWERSPVVDRRSNNPGWLVHVGFVCATSTVVAMYEYLSVLSTTCDVSKYCLCGDCV